MEIPGFKLDLSGLGRGNRPDPGFEYDLLILGGGPAAMTAAVYAARKVLRIALLTRDLGGQMGDTSEIENYMGFQVITGAELVQRFREQVEHFEVPILQGEDVESVTRNGDRFAVTLGSGVVFRGKTAILATGKRHRPLGVPGEHELVGRGVAYCAICDAPFYAGKRVAVAGGGNSAVTAALDLAKVGSEVWLINFAEGWQADEILMQALRRHGDRVHLLDHHGVVRIEGEDRVRQVVVRDRAASADEALAVDGIFVEIGLLPNAESVRGLVELNPWGEVVVDCHCRTSVPGLFAAGDVTTVPQKQIVISAGEGAKAALTAYDHLTREGLI